MTGRVGDRALLGDAFLAFACFLPAISGRLWLTAEAMSRSRIT